MRRKFWCVFACLALGCNTSPDVASPDVTAEESTPVPSAQAGLEQLARADPVAYFENCRDRTAREIHGLRGTLLMHERLKGKLASAERIAFWFRDNPYSIRMEWLEGAKLARKTLYVEGENDGYMLVQPSGWRSLAGIVRRLPTSEDATSSSRIPITRFGMQLGIESTLRAWYAARDRHELQVTFDKNQKVAELGDLPVWTFTRTDYKKPEDDGILEATYYIDPRTQLQVGTILRGTDGELIGSYFFRDLQLNPKFPADTFTVAGLKKN